MLATVIAMALASAQLPAPDTGIAEALARQRAADLAGVRYDLAFDIPAERSAPVRGTAVIRFSLRKPVTVVFDFAQPRERVERLAVGGKDVPAVLQNGHLVIDGQFMRPGENQVTIEFTAGDESLNRNDEFLYTLFVPARARFAFPCFDQPDVKARYTLSLDVPAGWEAVANGAETGRTTAAPARTRIRYAETEPLPTYLFAFAAGRFVVETATRDGRQMRMLHRETDAAKVAANRDAIFDLHASALRWLTTYTGIPYAFGKFDFVLIPSFQFSGMEHAGAILYNASSLLLDASATQNQQLERASVISHETAHMWFGDLVTMKWFNDVWMKEVFANFMAAKIVNPSFPAVNHELRFLLSNYPSAYSIDRTAGANPIRQTLDNLDAAGQLYGPIIYQKAPIVMRQLELLLGDTNMRDGLRDYLARYAFGNATWQDLVRILDDRTPRNLAAWSRAWVEERGRPELTTTWRVDASGRIRDLKLAMADPLRRGLVWPQRISVAIGYEGSVELVTADITGSTTTVAGANGLERPRFVLPNGEGLGYGLFLLDDDSRDYLLAHIEDVPDALTRGSAWVTLWDNLLEGRVAPRALVDAALRALPRESDEQNADRVLGYVNRAFWRFLSPDERRAITPALEATLRSGLTRSPAASQKAAWFNTYRDTALSPDALGWLERVWRREEAIPGLPLAEPDEITLSLELAVREVTGWDAILRTQLDRTQNPDRKARLAFVLPALSADPAERQQAFERLRVLENRRREPWVLESLRYLNHPLRAATAEGYVRPALDLLAEIQRTGDIFFPSRWMEATLSGHRSPGVAATVRQFLTERQAYPERLRWIVLSSADELFRAAGPSAPVTSGRRAALP